MASSPIISSQEKQTGLRLASLPAAWEAKRAAMREAMTGLGSALGCSAEGANLAQKVADWQLKSTEPRAAVVAWQALEVFTGASSRELVPH